MSFPKNKTLFAGKFEGFLGQIVNGGRISPVLVHHGTVTQSETKAERMFLLFGQSDSLMASSQRLVRKTGLPKNAAAVGKEGDARLLAVNLGVAPVRLGVIKSQTSFEMVVGGFKFTQVKGCLVCHPVRFHQESHLLHSFGQGQAFGRQCAGRF